ncbi:MAG: hypothetical protein H7Z15_09925 [Rhizobacter sp.]|nr:hypothetical protein [Rhizobacter sp.]
MYLWLKTLLIRQETSETVSERQHAINLIAAVDAGGIPLNPARVNHIARALGLEVSRHAPVEDTIARIRAVVAEFSTARE